MNTKEVLIGSVDQALGFIESVKERLIEIRSNPELLLGLDNNSGFSYRDFKGEIGLIKEHIFSIQMKDGRDVIISQTKSFEK